MAVVTNRIAYNRGPIPPRPRLLHRPPGIQQRVQHAPLPHAPPPASPPVASYPIGMLHVVLWKWDQPGFREVYSAERVNVAAAMLRRNLDAVPHRIVLVTDNRHGVDEELVKCYDLWSDHDNVANASGYHLPSCYRRLKLFDVKTQESLGIKKGDRVSSVDLDAVVTGSLSNIMYRRERFVSWAVPGTYHARVFNGSFWMFTAGDYQNLWSDFDPKESPRRALKSGFLGSDQGWLSMNLAKSADAHGVRWPEIASYPREVRRQRGIHSQTRFVFFHGGKKPWHPDVQRESPWITRYYRA
jgi:hypothetical protein